MAGGLAGAGTYPSRQRRYAATASQSGEMKGEVPPLHFTHHINCDRALAIINRMVDRGGMYEKG
jgi:hypothetical protein